MKDSLNFIGLTTRIAKALQSEGITVGEVGGSAQGLTADLMFKGKRYGLFLMETDILIEATKEIFGDQKFDSSN